MIEITEILKSLIGKINGKIIVIELAMILLFFLATSEVVNSFLFISVSIMGLALFYAIIQFVIDYKALKNKDIG